MEMTNRKRTFDRTEILAAHAERVQKRSSCARKVAVEPPLYQSDDGTSTVNHCDSVEIIWHEDDDCILVCDENEKTSRSRSYGMKPDNWIEILGHYHENGFTSTLQKYRGQFPGISNEGVRAKLKRWSALKPLKENRSRAPSYGREVDEALRQSAIRRLDQGLPVDDQTLRELLLEELSSRSMLEVLVTEHGGKFEYGHSWASRFFRRHNLLDRRGRLKSRR